MAPRSMTPFMRGSAASVSAKSAAAKKFSALMPSVFFETGISVSGTGSPLDQATGQRTRPPPYPLTVGAKHAGMLNYHFATF
jgi:hypothetical protein